MKAVSQAWLGRGRHGKCYLHAECSIFPTYWNMLEKNVKVYQHPTQLSLQRDSAHLFQISHIERRVIYERRSKTDKIRVLVNFHNSTLCPKE
jgi:hypothetical protein